MGECEENGKMQHLDILENCSEFPRTQPRFRSLGILAQRHEILVHAGLQVANVLRFLLPQFAAEVISDAWKQHAAESSAC